MIYIQSLSIFGWYNKLDSFSPTNVIFFFFSTAKEVFNSVYDLISEHFDQHLETYDENVTRDFMDIYIKEVRANAANKESIFFGQKGRQNMSALYVDLFIGGTETTATTINWTLLFLCLHQDKQKRL